MKVKEAGYGLQGWFGCLHLWTRTFSWEETFLIGKDKRDRPVENVLR
jgi:hypothetical protein